MSARSQYDDTSVAAAYTGSLELADLKSYVERPLVLEALGDVRERTILDVGCGHGEYCRLLKQAGAARVVGVDNSLEMIRIARDAESRDPLEIEYHHHSAEELPILGPFDVALAVYLLHYAQTRPDLDQMCAAIHRNLAPGGVLVGVLTFVEEPEFFVHGPNYHKYGLALRMPDTPHEGDKLTMEVRMDAPFSFDMVQWSRATYQQALRAAGFHDIVFTPQAPSAEGLDRFGRDFWRDFTEHPTAYIVRGIA